MIMIIFYIIICITHYASQMLHGDKTLDLVDHVLQSRNSIDLNSINLACWSLDL